MPSSSSSNRRHRRRNYTSVANDDMDVDANANADTDAETNDAIPGDDDFNKDDNGNNNDNDDVEKQCDLSIIILDATQKKFPIPCRADWTVGTFKRRSAKIHKIAPSQQRLIFRGRMLTDDNQTLRNYKLETSDLIVHLFPKPRVVVTASKHKAEESSGGGSGSRRRGANNGNGNDDDDGDTGILDDSVTSSGAHVTTITIDQEEQDRRGQILVLGSVEIAESQNNVKMLSLLLVMICAMRLLALFSIAMGAAEEPSDPYHQHNSNSNSNNGNGIHNGIHNHTGDVPHNQIYDSDFLDDTVVTDEYTVRTWQTYDYFDLMVSTIGFYVGTLGMKATQENTSLLATAYAIGTIIAGIGWNIWNVYEYIRFFKEQTEYRIHDDENEHNGNADGDGDGDGGANATNENGFGDIDDELPPLTRDDFVTVAFFTILMPLMVWVMCCVRAFEFRRLLLEAEEEAAERIRNEYVVREGAENDDDDDDDDDDDNDDDDNDDDNNDDDSNDDEDSGERRGARSTRVHELV